ncbi:hypothetical protein BH10PSE19_BH10PSE19_23150 [soil metagenome]
MFQQIQQFKKLQQEHQAQTPDDKNDSDLDYIIRRLESIAKPAPELALALQDMSVKKDAITTPMRALQSVLTELLDKKSPAINIAIKTLIQFLNYYCSAVSLEDLETARLVAALSRIEDDLVQGQLTAKQANSQFEAIKDRFDYRLRCGNGLGACIFTDDGKFVEYRDVSRPKQAKPSADEHEQIIIERKGLLLDTPTAPSFILHSDDWLPVESPPERDHEHFNASLQQSLENRLEKLIYSWHKRMLYLPLHDKTSNLKRCILLAAAATSDVAVAILAFAVKFPADAVRRVAQDPTILLNVKVDKLPELAASYQRECEACAAMKSPAVVDWKSAATASSAGSSSSSSSSSSHLAIPGIGAFVSPAPPLGVSAASPGAAAAVSPTPSS